MRVKKYQSIILLGLILILATFLRLWQIDSIPPGLYPDVAINGNDALDSLESGKFKVFYPENNGREGLFIWLIAFSFKIFGPYIWSLRLVSALIGILTVLGLYLLTKQLFKPAVILSASQESGGKRTGFGIYPEPKAKDLVQNDKAEYIALLSSFFLAVSFWHINFSRIGFRAILVPFFLVWSFYFLFKALQTKKVWNFILAGFFFGLGFYTYIAFRLAILILGLIVLREMWQYWRSHKPIDWNWSNLWSKIYIKDGWWRWDIMFLVIILVALPLGIYFFQNPQDFISRATGISVFETEHPWLALGKNTLKTLGMFNWQGDWNWRHNYAGQPMLAWPVGIIFILGFLLALKAAPRAALGQPCFARAALGLPLWFFIMLLPAIFTNEGIPHALRTIGTIPVIYIFAGLGLSWLIAQLKKTSQTQLFPRPFRKTAALLTVLVFILFLLQPALSNFNRYFFQWAQNPNVAGAFRQDLVDLGNYLNSLPTHIQKYVIVNEYGVLVNGIPMPAQTVMFVTQDSKIKYLLPEDIDQIKINSQPTVIIPTQDDESLFNQLLQKWPDGKIVKKENFWTYEID